MQVSRGRPSPPGGLWAAAAHGEFPSVPPGRAGCGPQRLTASFHLCRPQIGLFDLEVNCLTKILFAALVVVALVMVALQHFAGRWYLQIIRFLLLFSNIIPIRCAESEPVPQRLRVSVSLKVVLLWF